MKINGHGQAKILTDSEIMQIFIYTPQPYKTVYALCLYTGCRISEALSLKKKDVTDSVVMFPKGITKGHIATRTVDITQELRLFLDCYTPSRDSVWLFPGKRGVSDTIDRTTAHKVLKDISTKHGIIGVSTHSFRRTALTRMSNRGIPLRHIQEISGHRSLTELQKYLGVTDEDKLKAVKQLSFLG
ncbi:MAG: site-specific integrase [Iphinoe sp. HA4291-MV1]|nr:site-specific integrase [Iphinoe sp. HA4291-MV1]